MFMFQYLKKILLYQVLFGYLREKKSPEHDLVKLFLFLI